MSTVPFYQVGAFTSVSGKGNPAAVCFPTVAAHGEPAHGEPAHGDKPGGGESLSVPTDDWMQKVAAEFGYPETAFVYADGEILRLRWFTPAIEVDLCGHATLAAMHVIRTLFQSDELPSEIRPFWRQGNVQFASRSGVLTAEASADGIVLDFPATPVEACSVPSGLDQALGIDAGDIPFIGRSKFDVFVRLSSARQVRTLKPDMVRLATIPARGVIVTALGDSADHDFVSRFFAPSCNIPEDPVTGSAHCALATYWAPEFGRNVLFGYQASERGGHVRMDLRNDRVRLSGPAVLNLQGTLSR